MAHHGPHDRRREDKLLIAIMEKIEFVLESLARSERKEIELLMSISDQLAQEDANLTAIGTKLDSIATGIAALDALIQAFQNSPGTLSPADQAALDAIVNKSTALKAQADAISTAAPGA